jgi:hypothetical protein
VPRTWGTRMWCATHSSLVVDPRKFGGVGSGWNQRQHMASSRRVCQGEANLCGSYGRQIKITGVGP